MKKIFILLVGIILLNNLAFGANYQSTKNYKIREYNSQGRITGYTKVYYQGDKSNVRKIEKYSTSGKRTNLYR